MILFSQAPLISGQVLYASWYDISTAIIIVHIIVWVILLIVFEGAYQRFYSKDDPFVDKIQGLMTKQEFD